MAYEPIPTDLYETSLKKFLNTYLKSKSDVEALVKDIKKNPRQRGTPIPSFKGLLWKARGAMKAYNIGKSGGIRLIYYFDGDALYLIFLYCKRQMANPPQEDLRKWLKANKFITDEP